MLGDEYGTASNIKSRVNRLSVLSAITSTQQVSPKAENRSCNKNRANCGSNLTLVLVPLPKMQRLKLYNKVPPNGLVLYCGTVLTDEGKEKQVCVRAARVKTNARE